MARRPVVGVLALQGDVGDHARILTGLGAEVVEVRTPVHLDGVEALVLPGGESTAMSRLARTSNLIGPLRARLGDGMPAFGTCAGMILLAREIADGRPDQEQLDGIDIGVRRNAFGRQVDSFETDLDVTGVEGGPLHAVFIRAPLVERIGPGVEVLATITDAEGADDAVVCRQGPVMVSAFHPELSGDGRLHEVFLRGVVPG